MRCLWYAGWAIDPAWLASRLDELPWPEGEQPDCHVAPMGKRERAAWAHELAHPEDKTPRWWCGWSMGGLRAIEMAADDPLCEGIVVLAGTAQFCATDTWPFAIAVDQWRDLLQRWAKQPKQTLKRFYRMIAAGESRASADESASRLADNQFVAELIAQGVDLYANHATDLNEELHWLQSADVREQITRIQKPIVFLVGDQDPLLPAAQADALLSLSPFVRVKRLDGVGHAPFQGRAASCVASALMETFSSVCESADHAVSVSFTPAIDAINHRAIDGFGAVAARYNAGSALQRAVARSLLRRGPEKALSAASRVLDLGSGSGYIGEYWCQRWGAQPAWHLTGLDGSTAMLAEAARRLPDARLQWCHGYLEDPAMSLPSGADSWDVVVSNFALHWVERPVHALQAWMALLRPGAWLGLALPVAGSFSELRAAWAQIDDYSHTVSFPDWTEILALLARQPSAACQWWSQRFYTEHEDLACLRASLLAMGAASAHQGGRSGLTTPRQWKRLQAFYDRARTSRCRLPLAYEVGFVWWQKS